MGPQFWRYLASPLDKVIKANATAKVVPFAEVIAEEVLRHQHEHVIDQRGTGVGKEN